VIFFGAAFWAWHPLRVESVAWASGLLYAQSTALMFGALWLQLAGRRGAALGCYVLSLLTYPTAIGLWPVFMLLDASREGWLRAFRLNLGHTVAAAAIFATTLLGRYQVMGVWPEVPGAAAFPLWQRALQALYVDAHYLWRSFWPVGLTPVDGVALDLAHPSARLLVGAAATGVLAIVFLFSARARAKAGWFALAHLAVLIPVTGVIEKPYFPADRYAFLPQLIFAGALALLLARLTSGRFMVGAIGAAGLLACAALSHTQTAIWRDEPTMWQHIASRVTIDELPVLACARPALSLLRDGNRVAAFALIDNGVARRPNDPMLRATRDEMRQIDRDTRARATALGLATPPAPAAELHYSLAIGLSRAGDAEAAAQHFAAMGRIAPEYYARVTRAAALPAR
jgi:hypothetical protein